MARWISSPIDKPRLPTWGLLSCVHLLSGWVCFVANLQNRECQGKAQEEVSVEAMEAVVTRSRSELIQSIAAEAFVAPSRDRLSQAAYRFDIGTQRGMQSIEGHVSRRRP